VARLPSPGGDNNTWGTILNEFLTVEHNADGTLKSSGSLAGKVGTSRTVNTGVGLTGGGALSSDLTLSVAFGTSSTTVARGDDARLSDARTPTAHASTHAAAGSDPISPGSIGAVSTTGGGKEATATPTASSASTTIDLANGNVQLLTLAASTTISLSGATNGAACSLSLYIQQDSTGSRLITWPASVKWPGAAAPTLSTGANKIDLIVLETLNGGTTWFGSLAGADFR
jgi:hypothetical protein